MRAGCASAPTAPAGTSTAPAATAGVGECVASAPATSSRGTSASTSTAPAGAVDIDDDLPGPEGHLEGVCARLGEHLPLLLARLHRGAEPQRQQRAGHHQRHERSPATQPFGTEPADPGSTL
ncbi:hypothetical protein SUDANB108_00008 [Streptomyces sp. enrichment culture]